MARAGLGVLWETEPRGAGTTVTENNPLGELGRGALGPDCTSLASLTMPAAPGPQYSLAAKLNIWPDAAVEAGASCLPIPCLLVSRVLGAAVGWVEGCLSQLLGEASPHLAHSAREQSHDCGGNKGAPLPSALPLGPSF